MKCFPVVARLECLYGREKKKEIFKSNQKQNILLLSIRMGDIALKVE